MTSNIISSKDEAYPAWEMFDQILGRHLERLLGSRYGISALLLNMSVLTCLAVISQRENEADGAEPGAVERFTSDTLFIELDQMGFESRSKMDSTVQELIQKGYLHQDTANRLIPDKPTLSMARLLDRTFPKMPGINMAAYFAQTVEEVVSGRKAPQTAQDQFDQTLQMQGVCLAHKPRNRTIQNAPVAPSPGLKKSYRHKDARGSLSKPRILSSGSRSDALPVQKIVFGRVSFADPEPESIDPAPQQRDDPPPAAGTVKNPDPAAFTRRDPREDEPPCAKPCGAEVEPVSNLAPMHPHAGKPETLRVEATPAAAQIPLKSGHADPQEKPDDSFLENVTDKTVEDDAVIDEQVASFENNLAMECPVCRRAEVQIERTSIGKVYYKCCDRHCSFISWGKPFHVICPKCNNPFLVETLEAQESVLKCPRATCRHRQKLSGEDATPFQSRPAACAELIDKRGVASKPRRKVVRKRRVRRIK